MKEGQVRPSPLPGKELEQGGKHLMHTCTWMKQLLIVNKAYLVAVAVANVSLIF